MDAKNKETLKHTIPVRPFELDDPLSWFLTCCVRCRVQSWDGMLRRWSEMKTPRLFSDPPSGNGNGQCQLRTVYSAPRQHFKTDKVSWRAIATNCTSSRTPRQVTAIKQDRRSGRYVQDPPIIISSSTLRRGRRQITSLLPQRRP